MVNHTKIVGLFHYNLLPSYYILQSVHSYLVQQNSCEPKYAKN